jgi:hypothetical protein
MTTLRLAKNVPQLRVITLHNYVDVFSSEKWSANDIPTRNHDFLQWKRDLSPCLFLMQPYSRICWCMSVSIRSVCAGAHEICATRMLTRAMITPHADNVSAFCGSRGPLGGHLSPPHPVPLLRGGRIPFHFDDNAHCRRNVSVVLVARNSFLYFYRLS